MPTNDEIEWKDCWKKPVKVQYKEITETVEIETREGKLYGYAGKDVLIRGIRGEVYPCKIDIFNDTYTRTEPKSEEAIRAEVQSGKLTEAGQSLYARRKDIEAHTSKQIFNEIDEYVYVTGLSVKDKKADWFKEKYEALKKKYNIEA